MSLLRCQQLFISRRRNTYHHGCWPRSFESGNSYHSQQQALKASCSESDDEIAFKYVFPGDKGVVLRSASIDPKDGLPALHFEAADPFNHPSLTEEDCAIMAGVIIEGKRPEFFYKAIPKGYHFHGRQYKSYSPSWIKDTSIGDLLSKVDWKMKCLSIGAESNEEKTEFWSRQKTSKLQGLASSTDFPAEKKVGSIIMSCKSVKVEETSNCLRFLGEPEMTITDDACPTYGDYISSYYDSVAYHDEPLFLKMKELIKLIVVMEWFAKKGIKFSQTWISQYLKKNNSLDIVLYSEKNAAVGNELQKAGYSEIVPVAPYILQVCPHIFPVMMPLLPLNEKTYHKLFNETDPWPRVSFGDHHTMRTSLGGISTSSIGVQVATAAGIDSMAGAGVAAKLGGLNSPQNSVEVESSQIEDYIREGEILIKGSRKLNETSKRVRRRDMQSKEVCKPPTRNPKRPRGNRATKSRKIYGANSSIESFDENGQRIGEKSQKKSHPVSLGTSEEQVPEPIPHSSTPPQIHAGGGQSENAPMQLPPHSRNITGTPLTDLHAPVASSSGLGEMQLSQNNQPDESPVMSPQTIHTLSPQHDTDASLKPMKPDFRTHDGHSSETELIPQPSSPQTSFQEVSKHEAPRSPTSDSDRSCSSFMECSFE